MASRSTIRQRADAPSSAPPSGGSAVHDKWSIYEDDAEGLGKKAVKWMKKATAEKEASSGKRKALGSVTNGAKMLQERAAAKKELQKIQSKLPEMV